MTIRWRAIPALLAGALVAAAAVASGGMLAPLAALPPLLIAFALFFGRSAGVDVLLEFADGVHRRPRPAASTPTRVLDFDYTPLSIRPLLGGATWRGPPLVGTLTNALA